MTAMTAPPPQISPMGPLSPSPTVNAEDGYIKLSFPGKTDQLVQVAKYIVEQKMIPETLVQEEVSWFYKY